MDEGMINLTVQAVTKAAKGVLKVLEVYSPELADDWRGYLEDMARFADCATEMSRKLKENAPQIGRMIDGVPDDEITDLYKKILTGNLQSLKDKE